MTDQGDYDLKPADKQPETAKPKPGEPGWVEPVPIIEKPDPVEHHEDPPADPDVEKHKGLAIMAYIFFMIPLLLAPNSKFARFHANQGLLIFILWVITLIVGTILEVGWALVGPHIGVTILWFFFGCISHIVPGVMIILSISFTIVGIVHAANGERRELPAIGHLTLIK